MIVLVTEADGKRLVVSHGYDLETGEFVILPQVSPQEIGASFDPQLGEWILP